MVNSINDLKLKPYNGNLPESRYWSKQIKEQSIEVIKPTQKPMTR